MMVRKQCCEYWPALSSLLPLVFKYANIVVHIIQKEVLSQPRQESDAQDRFFFLFDFPSARAGPGWSS